MDGGINNISSPHYPRDNPPPSSGSTSSSVDAIAGAIASAVRQSLLSCEPGPSRSSSLEPNQSSESRSRIPLPSRVTESLPRVTEFDRASQAKKPKYSPPTLFEFARTSRSSRKKKQGGATKVISYVRDIILLPNEFKSDEGDVVIPRNSRREKLGKTGLVGKIEISSDMTEQQVRSEICEVFSTPMGLSAEDIKNGAYFKFSYLQRAGCNSRSLCQPTVKESFQWNGKQVASLAKSGSFIYLIADEHVPGWRRSVSLIISTCFNDMVWNIFNYR